MLAKRDAIASLHSDFYRLQYRRLLRWLIVLLLIMFVLMASIVYLVFSRPERLYYGNTVEGKILTMPKAYNG